MEDGKRWTIIAISVAIIAIGMWYWVRGEFDGQFFSASFVPGIGEASIAERPGVLPDLTIKGGRTGVVEPPGTLPDYRPTLTRGHYSTQI